MDLGKELLSNAGLISTSIILTIMTTELVTLETVTPEAVRKYLVNKGWDYNGLSQAFRYYKNESYDYKVVFLPIESFPFDSSEFSNLCHSIDCKDKVSFFKELIQLSKDFDDCYINIKVDDAKCIFQALEIGLLYLNESLSEFKLVQGDYSRKNIHVIQGMNKDMELIENAIKLVTY